MIIGILALQGGFEEHRKILTKLDIKSKLIRTLSDLNDPMLKGLIVPGGESTVILKLLRDTGLYEPLRKMIENGMPTYGTCAGMIVLANRIEDEEMETLGLIDITVRRNAYGRQLGSFQTEAEFDDLGAIPMVFIRAPYIVAAKDDVDILARVNGNIVAARQDKILVTSFHPELTDDINVHEYFIRMIRS